MSFLFDLVGGVVKGVSDIVDSVGDAVVGVGKAIAPPPKDESPPQSTSPPVVLPPVQDIPTVVVPNLPMPTKPAEPIVKQPSPINEEVKPPAPPVEKPAPPPVQSPAPSVESPAQEPPSPPASHDTSDQVGGNDNTGGNGGNRGDKEESNVGGGAQDSNNGKGNVNNVVQPSADTNVSPTTNLPNPSPTKTSAIVFDDESSNLLGPNDLPNLPDELLNDQVPAAATQGVRLGADLVGAPTPGPGSDSGSQQKVVTGTGIRPTADFTPVTSTSSPTVSSAPEDNENKPVGTGPWIGVGIGVAITSLLALLVLLVILFRRRRHIRNPSRRRRPTNPMTERAGLLRLNRHDSGSIASSRRASSLLFWDSDQRGAFAVESFPTPPSTAKRNSRDGELVRSIPSTPPGSGSTLIGSGSGSMGNEGKAGYGVNAVAGKGPNYGTSGTRPPSFSPFPKTSNRVSGIARAY